MVKSSPSPDKKVLLIINNLVTSVSRKHISNKVTGNRSTPIIKKWWFLDSAFA